MDDELKLRELADYAHKFILESHSIVDELSGTMPPQVAQSGTKAPDGTLNSLEVELRALMVLSGELVQRLNNIRNKV